MNDALKVGDRVWVMEGARSWVGRIELLSANAYQVFERGIIGEQWKCHATGTLYSIVGAGMRMAQVPSWRLEKIHEGR